MALLTRRKFLAAGGFGAATLAAVPAAYGYGRFLERHSPVIDEYSCPVSGLDKKFDGFRIGVIGDFHFDPLFESDFVDKCVRSLNATKPDAVILTGDYITDDWRAIEGLADVLSGIRTTEGAFAVLGNHDQWANPSGITRALEKAKLEVLRNSHATISRGTKRIIVAGLESVWGGRPSLPMALRGAGPKDTIILGMHEPDYWDQARKDKRVALQVSGHTHGGQLRIPMHGALRLPRYGRKYDSGLFNDRSQFLLVNRGIGTITYHVRVNCPPEISLITLRSTA